MTSAQGCKAGIEVRAATGPLMTQSEHARLSRFHGGIYLVSKDFVALRIVELGYSL